MTFDLYNYKTTYSEDYQKVIIRPAKFERPKNGQFDHEILQRFVEGRGIPFNNFHKKGRPTTSKHLNATSPLTKKLTFSHVYSKYNFDDEDLTSPHSTPTTTKSQPQLLEIEPELQQIKQLSDENRLRNCYNVMVPGYSGYLPHLPYGIKYECPSHPRIPSPVNLL